MAFSFAEDGTFRPHSIILQNIHIMTTQEFRTLYDYDDSTRVIQTDENHFLVWFDDNSAGLFDDKNEEIKTKIDDYDFLTSFEKCGTTEDGTAIYRFSCEDYPVYGYPDEYDFGYTGYITSNGRKYRKIRN